MSDSLLSVQGLNVRYASVQALFDVSIEVPQGAVVAVLGANGAGKSTLARAVSGLVPAFEGKVIFGGEDITSASPHEIRRAGLVHIPEGRGIFPGLSVNENLRMSPSPWTVNTTVSGLARFAPVASDGARPWRACITSTSRLFENAV